MIKVYKIRFAVKEREYSLWSACVIRLVRADKHAADKQNSRWHIQHCENLLYHRRDESTAVQSCKDELCDAKRSEYRSNDSSVPPQTIGKAFVIQTGAAATHIAEKISREQPVVKAKGVEKQRGAQCGGKRHRKHTHGSAASAEERYDGGHKIKLEQGYDEIQVCREISAERVANVVRKVERVDRSYAECAIDAHIQRDGDKIRQHDSRKSSLIILKKTFFAAVERRFQARKEDKAENRAKEQPLKQKNPRVAQELGCEKMYRENEKAIHHVLCGNLALSPRGVSYPVVHFTHPFKMQNADTAPPHA